MNRLLIGACNDSLLLPCAVHASASPFSAIQLYQSGSLGTAVVMEHEIVLSNGPAASSTKIEDLLADLLLLTGAGSAWLRGYAPNAFEGTGFHLVSAEWRLPLHRLRRGLDTLPIFARDVSLALFTDAGWAGDEPFELSDMESTHVGLGAELRLEADLLFGASASFRLGYARGLDSRGLDHVYLLMAPPP